jgi:hypothetical protein
MNVKTYTKEEAIKLLDEGKKVKLPEWLGYWFKDNSAYLAHLRSGDTASAWLHKYDDRTDFVEVAKASADGDK